jgi:GT2 family glycosyltransferase
MDKECAINRLVEFKNLSVIDQPHDQTVLCAEVTSQHPDVERKVIEDVVQSGLLRHDEILDTMVLHEEYGYAVYDLAYANHLAQAREKLQQFGNLHLLGRSAEFEHLEVDDIYANARALVTQLAPSHPVVPSGGVSVQESLKAPQVYTVVLTFNHYADTRECLESLKKLDYENMTLVVVDNGSSDGTPDRVRSDFPDVQLIETGRNLGVPWGFNVGFSHALRAGAEYILMLNNDTIIDPAMLRHLLQAAQDDPHAGVMVPKVLYYDDPEVIWSAGGRHRSFPPAHVILGQNHPSAAFDKPFYLEYALSCGLLIHRRAFEKAGLFDPGYFFFFDDWDFSHRVRAHGLHIIFVPDAKMWHKVSKSTREVGKETLFWKVWGESSTRFYRRHGRPVFISLPVHLGYMMLRELVKGNGKMIKHFWAGVREGLSRPLGPIPTTDDMELLPSPVDKE